MVEMLKEFSNPEIAEDLGVSVNTVRATLRSAFVKLGAKTRTEAYWNWRQQYGYVDRRGRIAA